MRVTASASGLCLVLFGAAVGGACRTLEVQPAPFQRPDAYAHHFDATGFRMAFVPVLDSEASRAQFNVDFTGGPVMPVRVIVENTSQREILLEATQVFGVTSDGDFYQSYDLDQSTRIVRRSEIGKGVATSAAVGALAGAVVGAGVGAGIGYAADDGDGARRGAAAGAVIGGTAGAASGAASGADAITQQIRREMRRADWGSQVVYPGEMKTGYVFLPRAEYREMAFNIYDLMERRPISGALPFGN